MNRICHNRKKDTIHLDEKLPLHKNKIRIIYEKIESVEVEPQTSRESIEIILKNQKNRNFKPTTLEEANSMILELRNSWSD
jgi:hypothetical protein